jgi:hypothetical protein
MVKMTLTFNLDDPDDVAYSNLVMKSKELYFSLLDLDSWLREKIKYGDKEEYQSVRDQLHDMMEKHGVNLEMLP